MGLYPADCSSCKQPFLWFSGNIADSTCADCKSKNLLKGYGKTMGLHEILEELVIYCNSVGVSNADIKLILPKAIIDQFSLSFRAKERTVSIPNLGKATNLRKIVCSGGTVELHSDNDVGLVTGLSDLQPINNQLQPFVVGGWVETGEVCPKCSGKMIRNRVGDECSELECNYIKK